MKVTMLKYCQVGNVCTKILIGFFALQRLWHFVTASGAAFHNLEPSLMKVDWRSSVLPLSNNLPAVTAIHNL